MNVGTAPPIAVVGAGFLGRRVAAELAGRKTPVRAFTRSGAWSGGTDLPVGVSLGGLDALEASEAELCAALRGIDGAVLCVAPGPGADPRALYVEGGRRLGQACAATRVRRVVHVSSTSALPDLDGPIDESCTVWPDSERGRIQREAEAAVTAALGAAGVELVILRLGGIYGPGREIGASHRRSRLPGDGMVATNLVHVEDAAAAVVAALFEPAAAGAVIHVCDDDHTSRRDLYARLAAVAGEPAPAWERAAAPNAQVRGKRVANGEMRRILGVRLKYPTHTPGAPA